MAGSGIEWDDRAFQKGLKAALRGFEVRTERSLVVLGLTVQNRARELCPVDTGRLRASITSSGLQRDSRGAYVEIGTNVEYAGHVEFGTVRAAAQPYLRPALLHAAQTWGRG